MTMEPSKRGSGDADTTDQKVRTLDQKYIAVFATAYGKEVLEDIYVRGGLGEPCMTEEQMGRGNLAKEIVARALHSDDGSVVRRKLFDFIKKVSRRK